MPQSRKRSGHQYQKPASVPARQRAKGTVVWAVLFAVFGLMIAFFAAGTNYIALAVGLLAGAATGYLVGKRMETEAKK